jgi:opacity protein-like surface antigen
MRRYFEDELALLPDANGSLPPVDLPAPDITAAGRRSRVTSLSSGASLDHALSARDSLSLGITAGITRSEDRLGGDYQTAGGSAFFRRMISERTGMFASLRGGLADYRNSTQGDGFFLTPMLGLDYRLSDRLSVNVSAGVSFTSVENGIGGRVRKTNVAGELALCRRETNGSICAAVSRRAQPTLYGGITTATNANVIYTRNLSDRDQLSFGGGFGRSEGGISTRSNVAGRPRELVSTFVDYRHELSDRLSGFITPRYERIFDRTAEDRHNFAIIAGITYRIGSVR